MNAILAPSSVVETIRKEFNFTVDRLPLTSHREDRSLTTPIFGLFRSDNDQFIGSRSVTDQYVPHTVDDIVALVEAAVQAFDGTMTVRTYFRNGHFVELTPTVDYRRSIFGTDDNIFPRLLIDAGYNAKSFRASIGYFRDMCQNMHIMRQVKGSTVSIRHTSSLRGKMDELIKTFAGLKDRWHAVADQAVELAAVRVDIDWLLEKLFPSPEPDATDLVKSKHAARNQKIRDRIESEMIRMGKGEIGSNAIVSGWDALNGVQGYFQHDVKRKGKPNDFARMLAANNEPVIQQAEAILVGLI